MPTCWSASARPGRPASSPAGRWPAASGALAGNLSGRDRPGRPGTSIGPVTMTLLTSQTSPRDIQADAIVIGVIQGDGGALPAPGARDVDQALDGGLAATLSVLGATGRAEEITKIAAAGRLAAPLIVAVGIGPVQDGAPLDGEALRRAAGAAVRALAAAKPRQVALALPARNDAEAEAVGLGALLGGYVFSRYLANGHQPATELTIIGSGSDAAVRRARTLADAVTLVRDLVNTGPSHLFPSAFAAEAERIAGASGLDIEVLDERALADGGYGGITGVGQGSVRPPRLVRLAYSPPGATKTVVFAGKGITFDSGGLSLKPPKAMETMKSDMGGAAAVLAAMQALAALGPAVNVIGYMPLAENMPSGTAQRPSDVITIFGGTTVEVLNTDAEGRLVLADALVRASEEAPDFIVDAATLTGAQLVALGTRTSGVMANDDAFRTAVFDAATRAGEQMWPMPIPPELRKSLDSSIADIANIGDAYGGMLVAASFLSDFVGDN